VLRAGSNGLLSQVFSRRFSVAPAAAWVSGVVVRQDPSWTRAWAVMSFQRLSDFGHARNVNIGSNEKAPERSFN